MNSAARSFDRDDVTEEPQPIDLGEVLTIAQAARKAKWSTSRMRRYLVAKNIELDGGLLVDVGRGKIRPRWTVATAALMVLHPQWFLDPDSLQRQLEWMKAGQDDIRVHLLHLSKRIDQVIDRVGEITRTRNVSGAVSPAERGRPSVRRGP